MVEKGEIDFIIMLMYWFKIDDIVKVYKLQEKREEGLVKCFVEMRFFVLCVEGILEFMSLQFFYFIMDLGILQVCIGVSNGSFL